MAGVRDDFLATARAAALLLRDPAVLAAWDEPSALPEFSVRGLAGHLAYQVLAVSQALAEPAPTEPVVPLLEHYARVAWIGADLSADINVRIRDGGEALASDGPSSLLARVDSALSSLEHDLAAAGGPVRIPLWGPWALTLDDLLITRMMELVVHTDDLAVSVDIPTPPVPPSAMETVLDLLTRLAVRRHGPTNVLRALTRTERAPTTITAF
ncbi:maleylpyruvate isomerase N-terminal domain-containing protein [Nonomuraea sediminis]|uniref:maleylpyruvate isomerase N-terminal domain-containing protein n=1 Tax=Nonomuraea sediminis TaxID=2835864 RepID=UPI001BDBF59A|nr:maleylpyruvate isomerase N-terminal domain-containing protein [Nonomuraea sediminis]